MSEKCLVKGCPNHKHEGKFIGDLCAPCATYLKEGRIGPSEAWFVEAIKQRDELLEALQGADVLFAHHCKDATAANWLDSTRAIIAEMEGGEMRDDIKRNENPENPIAEYGKKLVALGIALQDKRSTVEELACLANAVGLSLQFHIAEEQK